MRRRWRGWLWIVCWSVLVAVLLVLGTFDGGNRRGGEGRSKDDRLDGEPLRQALRQQIAGPRATEGRLAGFSWGPAPSTPRAAPSASTRPPTPTQVRLAATIALQEVEGRETAGALYTAGLAHLILGDLGEAVDLLEESRRSSGRAAPRFLSDLACAYLQRGLRAGRSSDVAVAADFAGLAASLPGAPLEAWFNRAIALDALELSERARVAWTSYISEAGRRQPAGESDWIREARQRLARVPVRETSTWPDARERLDRGDGFDDQGTLRSAAGRHPVPLREYVQDVLLPAWGRAWAKGDVAAASIQVDRVTRVANALTPGGHGTHLSEMVDRLQSIARSPQAPAGRRLAAGLTAYGEGRRLYELNRVAESIPFFSAAARDLTDVPVLNGWARLHQAVGLYLSEQWRPLDEALTRIVADAERLKDPALSGRAYRLFGVAAARQGRLETALVLKQHARDAYERADDGEELAGIEASLAETEEMVGHRSDSWESLRRALRGLDRINKGRREQALFAVAVWGCVRQRLYSLAAEYQLELTRRAEQRGEPIGRFEATVLAARLLRQAERVDEALEHLALAREQLAHIADPGYRARAGFELEVEDATVRLGSNPRDAVERLTRLIGAADVNKSVARLPDLYHARGRAFAQARNTDAARRDFDAGLDTIDRISDSQLSGPLRLAIRDSRRQLLRDALELSLVTDASGRAGLDLIERRRARETYGADIVKEPAISLEGLQQALPQDVGVLTYASVGSHIYAWFVTSSTYRFVRLPALAPAIDALIVRLRRHVMNDTQGVGDHAAALGEVLLAPVLNQDGGARVPARLFIIPDEPLHLVPFALLRTSGGQPLIAQTTIVHATSARAVLRPWRRFEAPEVLALAVRDARRTDLPVLREAIPEAEAVAAAYSRGRVLKDAVATNASLTQGLADADVIHVVSHAVTSEDDGLRALVLPGGDDSVVAVTRPVRTRLLVLSACGTAEGPYVAGEGPRSIATRYLQAGVEQVVGTLWSIRDDESRRFMTRLHAAVARGEDVPHTIRGLEEEMARDGQAPVVWAPYVTYVR